MILLASRSPQRRLLLEQAGLPFQVVETSDDDDDTPGRGPAQAQAVERAIAKARAAEIEAHRDRLLTGQAVILAADTLVGCQGQAFGKPADRAEAVRILMTLQGTRHTVVTAHCCRGLRADGSNIEAIGVAMTHVTMLPMRPEEVQEYVDSGEADGRDGAYAFQESGDRFVADLAGDPDTVIGLHVATAQRLYQEMRAALGGEA